MLSKIICHLTSFEDTAVNNCRGKTWKVLSHRPLYHDAYLTPFIYQNNFFLFYLLPAAWMLHWSQGRQLW